MILSVVDANGAPQQVCVAAPGQAADVSTVVSASLPAGPGPYTYQQLLPAAATPTRAGWWVRNRGTNLMLVTEDGTDPSTSHTASPVYPGEMFPPPGVGYPVTQAAVLLAGTAGDVFSAKVW